jgi:hypothetical protein
MQPGAETAVVQAMQAIRQRQEAIIEAHYRAIRNDFFLNILQEVQDDGKMEDTNHYSRWHRQSRATGPVQRV